MQHRGLSGQRSEVTDEEATNKEATNEEETDEEATDEEAMDEEETDEEATDEDQDIGQGCLPKLTSKSQQYLRVCVTCLNK